MLKLRYTRQFKKDFKKAKKRGLPMEELKIVLDILASEKPLPPSYHDHSLLGEYASFRECHIRPDWLLIYRIHEEVMELIAQRTGSHSDLFDE